jgi:thioesterase domain-containing protein/acyl carrier protein
LASLSETSFVAPRTPDEERLEEIWRKILSIDRISVTHDFFDLGGHSLLAVRLISEIQEAFGRKLSLADFFQEPTIERFARFLSSGGRSSVQWKSLLPIQTSGSQKPFFWVHGEESNRVLPRYLSPDQPLYGILHQAHDGLPAQHTSVESIAAHYLSEMKTVQPDGPYRIGGYCFGAMIAFEMAHQLEREGQEIELLFLLDPSPLLCRPSSPSARNGRAVLRAGAPATTLGSEMSRHLKRVGSLKLKDAIEYVFVRLKNKAIKMFVPKSVMTAVKNTVCRFYLALGRRLPFSLRSFYILKIYVSAMQRYSPRNFEGSAVVFMGEEEFNFLSGAPQLPTKTVHAYSIPGDHGTILREPQVSVWAEQLNHLLQTSTREE